MFYSSECPVYRQLESFISPARMLLYVGVAILTVCSPGGAQPRTSVRNVKVLVIGAGAAGLSATQDLLKAGFNVTILEASDRYGGRLWSPPSETGEGWIEMGGQWVHGNDHELWTFTEERNLLKKPGGDRKEGEDEDEDDEGSDTEVLLFNADGTKVENMRTYFRMYAMIDAALSKESEFTAMRAQTGLSMGEYLLNTYQQSRRRIRANNTGIADQMYDLYVRSQKEDYGAANFFDISVQSITNITLDGPDSTNLNVPYTDVLKMWAPDSVNHIQYRSLVKQIRFSQSPTAPVTVVLANGAQMTADHVLMTAPIGHMKAHLGDLFSPPLSQRKTMAIQTAGFGTLGKLHLVYETEWWKGEMPKSWSFLHKTGSDNNVDRNKTYPGQPWTRAIVSFLQSPTTKNTLVVLLGGPQAVQMETLSDAEVSTAITNVLRQSTGKSIPAPSKILRAKWSQNDLFRGTYSHISLEMVKKGLTTSDLASNEYVYEKNINGRNLRIPGLLFAGEATHSKYWSMVHGALLSGQRAAKTLKDIYQAGAAVGQKNVKAAASQPFSHQYVFDWMKVLTNPEIYALLAQKEVVWPERSEYDIPAPSFTCADKQYPGYYADPATKCQTFHRCDVNGNMTSYICVNRTLFNPITLICDYWFNVDCDGFIKDENFGNRRLYTSEVLFDTPKGGQGGNAAGPGGNWIWVDHGAAAAPATEAPAEDAAPEVPVTSLQGA